MRRLRQELKSHGLGVTALSAIGRICRHDEIVDYAHFKVVDFDLGAATCIHRLW